MLNPIFIFSKVASVIVSVGSTLMFSELVS